MTRKSDLLAALLAVSLSFLPVTVRAQQSSSGGNSEARPCHWWQLRCHESTVTIEGLPPDAPKSPTLVTVDVSTNTAYLFSEGELVAKGPAATGTGKVLKKGLKIWAFHTPRGRMKVLRKLEDPVWTKPDWAFVEAGEPVPPPNSKKREVRGHLGKYALDLGDGIMIHGTDEIDSLGRKASHGCVRLGNDLLEKVWQATKVGTDVYIFESKPAQLQSTTSERHSDLD